MANTVLISSKLGGRETTTHTWANDLIIIPGNSSVSNITSNATEIVVGATIVGAKWGLGGGHAVVSRSNSSVNNIVAVFSGAGFWPSDSAALNMYPITNIKIEFVGTANGVVILELHKQSSF